MELKNRVEIDITNLKVKEIEEVSKKHPNGYIKNKEGRVVWVYEKNEEELNDNLGEFDNSNDVGYLEDETICDNYAEKLVEEA